MSLAQRFDWASHIKTSYSRSFKTICGTETVTVPGDIPELSIQEVTTHLWDCLFSRHPLYVDSGPGGVFLFFQQCKGHYELPENFYEFKEEKETIDITSLRSSVRNNLSVVRSLELVLRLPEAEAHLRLDPKIPLQFKPKESNAKEILTYNGEAMVTSATTGQPAFKW